MNDATLGRVRLLPNRNSSPRRKPGSQEIQSGTVGLGVLAGTWRGKSHRQRQKQLEQEGTEEPEKYKYKYSIDRSDCVKGQGLFCQAGDLPNRNGLNRNSELEICRR